MSEHVNGTHRDQTVLFPDTIDQYVEKENPVRFIDAFVDSLNLEKLGFKHSIPAETGRPSYDPSDLLKLYVYGYLNQVRSSRKLEKECHRNVEVMWLMKKLAPDHKTIADFRKDNVDCIKASIQRIRLPLQKPRSLRCSTRSYRWHQIQSRQLKKQQPQRENSRFEAQTNRGKDSRVPQRNGPKRYS